MAESAVSDMTYQSPQQTTQHRYQSKMYEDFQNTQTSHIPGADYREHARSPSMGTSTMGASTLTSSDRTERTDDKAKHFSDASQVNYAEISSPQPQFVDITKYRESDKEAYRQSTMSGSTAQDPSQAPIKDDVDSSSRRRRICGLTVPKFFLVLIGLVVVVLALALGLGLGLGLGTKKKNNSSSNGDPAAEAEASLTMIGGAVNPKYYSHQGAFNGSGIAIASTSSGVDPAIFVFYQQSSGAIQQLLYQADGTWYTGPIVASDARNATPISAVAYTTDNVATMHLFYIDKTNIVRQKTSTNSSSGTENIWMDGPLSGLHLQTTTSELVGLQACYWGNYYGSSSNINAPATPAKSNPTTGMNLFFASDNTTFEQYDWTNGQDTWNHSSTFSNMNTHAGVACQSWLSGTVQYLFMVDPTDTLRIMWRDTNSNLTSTTSHPIGKWTNTSVSIPGLAPASSLGYTDFLAYQGSEGLFHGVNITWAAENTTIAQVTSNGVKSNDQWVVDSNYKGILGSHMAITALDTRSGGRQLAIMYQSINPTDDGDGITIGWRDSSSQGGWSQASVPVNGTNQ